MNERFDHTSRRLNLTGTGNKMKSSVRKPPIPHFPLNFFLCQSPGKDKGNNKRTHRCRQQKKKRRRGRGQHFRLVLIHFRLSQEGGRRGNPQLYHLGLFHILQCVRRIVQYHYRARYETCSVVDIIKLVNFLARIVRTEKGEKSTNAGGRQVRFFSSAAAYRKGGEGGRREVSESTGCLLTPPRTKWDMGEI